MSDTRGRDRIFKKIGASLEQGGVSANERHRLAQSRIAARMRHPTPARSLLDAVALRAQFTAYLTKGHASVIDVATSDGIPDAVAGYLRANNRPMNVRMGGDARLADLPWSRVPTL
jgi:L-lactate dehydrogenase complex protein LldG